MSAIVASTTVEPLWLTDVRLRAQRRVLWCRELWARTGYIGEESLAIRHGEVDAALAGADELRAAELSFYASDGDAARITAELALLADALPEPRWAAMCTRLAIDQAEQELLAVALAAELYPSLRRVYGYLQDDVVPFDATPTLAAQLFERACPARFELDSALVRWALARPVDAGDQHASSLTRWVADPLTLDHLLSSPRRCGPFARLASAPLPCLHARELDDILRFVRSVSCAHVEIELVAPPGSGRTSLAAHVAARLGAELFVVDSNDVVAASDPIAAASREVRCARLSGAFVAWRDAHKLSAEVVTAMRSVLPVMFLLTEERLPVGPVAGGVRNSYSLPPLDRGQRLAMWSARGRGVAPEAVAEWGLRPAEIETVADVAAAGDDAVRAVCRRMLTESPHDLLAPLAQSYTWDDLVVSPQLAGHLGEFEAQARGRGEVLDEWGLGRLTPLGRGVTALFAGPSGTGKTMAAQVLSRSLGVELYRVDLAGVVNKYIGETEKHLRAVFAACERAPVMLFFDEADALFGRRMQVNDAHDRFANIEVDYLLQRMEQFDGVAVLATNRKGDLDTAFMRRLRFTIDFAPPTVDERERLWRHCLDGTVDTRGRGLVGEIDWASLARELDLTGAGIKSASLGAAFLARTEGTAIEMRHLLAAARRELEKEGIVVRSRLEAVG